MDVRSGHGRRTCLAEQRHRAVQARAAALERERVAAATEARQLLAGFLRELTRRGIPPQPLRHRLRRLT